VAAAFGEDDVRTGHQVLDRPGDQDLRRPRQLRHPVGDLHRSAGDVLTDQVHLAGVDPGPDLDPRRGRPLPDRGRAPDRLPGSVEGSQDVVRRGPDQPAPVPSDKLSGFRDLSPCRLPALLASTARPPAMVDHGRLSVQDRG